MIRTSSPKTRNHVNDHSGTAISPRSLRIAAATASYVNNHYHQNTLRTTNKTGLDSESSITAETPSKGTSLFLMSLRNLGLSGNNSTMGRRRRSPGDEGSATDATMMLPLSSDTNEYLTKNHSDSIGAASAADGDNGNNDDNDDDERQGDSSEEGYRKGHENASIVTTQSSPPAMQTTLLKLHHVSDASAKDPLRVRAEFKRARRSFSDDKIGVDCNQRSKEFKTDDECDSTLKTARYASFRGFGQLVKRSQSNDGMDNDMLQQQTNKTRVLFRHRRFAMNLRNSTHSNSDASSDDDFVGKGGKKTAPRRRRLKKDGNRAGKRSVVASFRKKNTPKSSGDHYSSLFQTESGSPSLVSSESLFPTPDSTYHHEQDKTKVQRRHSTEFKINRTTSNFSDSEVNTKASLQRRESKTTDDLDEMRPSNPPRQQSRYNPTSTHKERFTKFKTLARYIGNHRKFDYTTVYLDGKELGLLEFRCKETAAQTRQRLDQKFNISSEIYFCYAGVPGKAVLIEEEDRTKIQACMNPSGLAIRTISSSFLQPQHQEDTLNFNAAEIRELEADAEALLRLCFRLLEEEFSNKDHGDPNLPSASGNCNHFVRLVARAVVDSRKTRAKLNDPGVHWRRVEQRLRELEDYLRICVGRKGFALWWLYRNDQKKLKTIMSLIQSEFRRSPNLSADHKIFTIEFHRAGAQVEALLDILNKSSLEDFAGKKYDTVRAKLAGYLGTSSLDLKLRIQQQGRILLREPNVAETKLFRPHDQVQRTGLMMRDFGDNCALEGILAPLHKFQESFIQRMESSFVPNTRKWAFEEFDSWLDDYDSDHRCFIFTGQEAFGKTSFLSRLVRTRSEFCLAYHFCRNDDYRFRDPRIMLLSITHQLTLQSPQFRRQIRAILVNNCWTRKRLLSDHCSLSTIFNQFILNPLSEISVPDTDKFVILIDGIDCAHQGETKKNEILDTLVEYFLRLPSWVSFVFGTRPKLPVLRRLRGFHAKVIEATCERNSRDLSTYFDYCLTNSGYGAEADIRELSGMLVDNAKGNFVYAMIIRKKLEEYQKTRNSRPVDVVMMNKLDGALEVEYSNIQQKEIDMFWNIVKVCVVAIKPLSNEFLAELIGVEKETVSKLTASQPIIFDISDSRVRFQHKIIRDWILNCLGGLKRSGNCFGQPKHSTHQHASITGSSQKGIILGGVDDVIIDCHSYFAERAKHLIYSSVPGQRFKFKSQMTKGYILEHGVHHLALAKLKDEAKKIILDPAWLASRAQDLEGIVSCCELLSEGDQVLHLVGRAVKMSTGTISGDSRQLIGQLVGRLVAVTEKGHGDHIVREKMTEFLKELRAYDYGFDWWIPVAPTWDQAEEANLRHLAGHTGPIQSVGYHPAGRRCASGSWDGTIRIWDTLTGHCERVLTGHKQSVWSIDWEPQGEYLVSGGMDKVLRLFDPMKGKCIKEFFGHSDFVWASKWSSDGKRIASGSRDKTIRIWDPKSGECLNVLSTLSGCSFYSVAWEGNSTSRLCSGGTDSVVRIWDSVTGSCLHELVGHKDWVRSVEWCPMGRNIISGSADRTVRVWDPETFEIEQVLMGHDDSVWSVAKSFDGQFIASASTDGTARIWDCTNGRSDQVFADHSGPVWTVAWGPDGQRLISGSSDKQAIVWDTSIGRKQESLPGHSKPIWSLDVSKDSSLIVSGSSDKTARLWNVAAGRCQRVFTGHSGPVWSVQFSYDGKKVLTGSTDNTAAIYKISSGERMLQLLGHSASIWCVAWAVGDKLVLTGSRDTTVRIWDAATGHCISVLEGHEKDVRALAVSFDGKRLATASLDATIRIWDLQSKECVSVLEGNGDSALSVKWHPDNIQVAVGYTSGCIRVWNANTGEHDSNFFPGHSRRANSVHWSPDGNQLVSASSDKEIRLWDTSSPDNRCINKFQGSTGNGVFGIKWTRDGKYIVSCGADKSIRLFNPESGRCEQMMSPDSALGIFDVTWSSDGKYVVAGSRNRTVEIWNSGTGQCEKRLRGHTNWVYFVTWEENGDRVLSRSDDGTTRVWDVKTGNCLEVVEDQDYFPEDFVECKTKKMTNELSGGKGRSPVGVKCDKIRVYNNRAVGWIRSHIYFFELVQSETAAADERQLHEKEQEQMSE